MPPRHQSCGRKRSRLRFQLSLFAAELRLEPACDGECRAEKAWQRKAFRQGPARGQRVRLTHDAVPAVESETPVSMVSLSKPFARSFPRLASDIPRILGKPHVRYCQSPFNRSQTRPLIRNAQRPATAWMRTRARTGPKNPKHPMTDNISEEKHGLRNAGWCAGEQRDFVGERRHRLLTYIRRLRRSRSWPPAC